LLSQLPSLQVGQLENWLLPAVAVLSIVALLKKVFPPKRGDKDLVTRSELHEALTSMRDSIDARLLALSEKLEHLTSSVHQQLAEIKSAIARLDERSRH